MAHKDQCFNPFGISGGVSQDNASPIAVTYKSQFLACRFAEVDLQVFEIIGHESRGHEALRGWLARFSVAARLEVKELELCF